MGGLVIVYPDKGKAVFAYICIIITDDYNISKFKAEH